MKKKRILLICGSVIGALLLLVCLSVLTTSLRVRGIWQTDAVFLEKYERDCLRSVLLKNDGTFAFSISDKDTGEILNMRVGTWKTKGLSVLCKYADENDRTLVFTYNPVTNRLNNGGGLLVRPDDYIYKKVK